MEAQFAVKGVTTSLTKFYYFLGALGCLDAAQIMNLIEFPPDLLHYESLKEHLTQLHTLNPFQRYQAFMSLTWPRMRSPPC